jgi:hypothetical protein
MNSLHSKWKSQVTRIIFILTFMAFGVAIEATESASPPKKSLLGKAKQTAISAKKSVTSKINCMTDCSSKKKCDNNEELAKRCTENCGEKTVCYITFHEKRLEAEKGELEKQHSFLNRVASQLKTEKGQLNVQQSRLEAEKTKFENEQAEQFNEEEKMKRDLMRLTQKTSNFDKLFKKILALPCEIRYQIIDPDPALGALKKEERLTTSEKDSIIKDCVTKPANHGHVARSLIDLPERIAPSSQEDIDAAISIPNRLLEAKKSLDLASRQYLPKTEEPQPTEQSDREKQLNEYFEIFEKEYYPMIRNLRPERWQNKKFWTAFLNKFKVHDRFPDVTEEDMIDEFSRLTKTNDSNSR